MEIFGGLIFLVLLAAFIGLVIDVRGARKDQREYLDAILAELRLMRQDR